MRKSDIGAGRDRRPETAAFGRILAEARVEAGLSQETLAFEAGYHPKYISMLERGLSSPSLTAILRMATVLKLSGWELVQRTEGKLGRIRSRKTGV